MSTITSMFQQAQLAEAAYANFFETKGTELKGSIKGVSIALLLEQ